MSAPMSTIIARRSQTMAMVSFRGTSGPDRSGRVHPADGPIGGSGAPLRRRRMIPAIDPAATRGGATMGGMEGWLPVVVAVVAVVAILVLVDRLTAAGVFDRRDDRPRERRPGGGGGAGALGALLDFYDPSHQHLTEEQQREKSTTVQVPGEAPPLIDLDAGTAVIERDDDRRERGTDPRPGDRPTS